MSLANFYIVHPKNGRKISQSSRSGKLFLLCYGRWTGPQGNLTGRLVAPNGTTYNGYPAQVKRPRLFWAMGFLNISPGSGYQLHVEDSVSHTCRTVTDLEFVSVTAAIDITFPIDDDMPVGRTFMAYGTTDNPAVTADLLLNNVTAEPIVTTLFNPKDNPPFWAFQIEAPASAFYTMRISNSAANDTKDQSVDVI